MCFLCYFFRIVALHRLHFVDIVYYILFGFFLLFINHYTVIIKLYFRCFIIDDIQIGNLFDHFHGNTSRIDLSNWKSFLSKNWLKGKRSLTNRLNNKTIVPSLSLNCLKIKIFKWLINAFRWRKSLILYDWQAVVELLSKAGVMELHCCKRSISYNFHCHSEFHLILYFSHFGQIQYLITLT